MITRDAFGRITDAITCPDCNAARELLEIEPHVFALAILHDETCPWFNERKSTS